MLLCCLDTDGSSNGLRERRESALDSGRGQSASRRAALILARGRRDLCVDDNRVGLAIGTRRLLRVPRRHALKKAGVEALPVRALSDFWPARGPVWDAIGRTTEGVAIFVEAKAHIPEAASPGTRASPTSLELISRSLEEARRWYAPKASASWTGTFYQYANRLAHHYFLREVNKVPTKLVFVYFTHDPDMTGPENESEWHGAIRLLHAALGLPA